MQQRSFKLEWFIWGILAVVVIGIVVAFVKQRSGPSFDKLAQVTDFSLTNQWNEVVTPSSLRGQVWLANIIFTRCPGPCTRMTRQFAEIQAGLPKDKPVKMVSLTADPEYDTPSVLREYAERFGAERSTWHFLTGPKREVYRLAMEGLLLAVQEKLPEQQESIDDLFIHSTMIVLVDKNGFVRSFYESTDPGVNDRIQADVRQLLRR